MAKELKEVFPQLPDLHGDQQFGTLGWMPHILGDMGLGWDGSTQGVSLAGGSVP